MPQKEDRFTFAVKTVLSTLILSAFLLFMFGQISSYEEYVKAGHPIMESFPRKCQTPDGKIFYDPADIAKPSG